MSKSILVIGNGFDLDLGLETKYSDFAKSDFWPKVNFKLLPITKEGAIIDLDGESKIICMTDYIETNRTFVLQDSSYTWFDLENELLNFTIKIAPHNIFSTAKDDKHYFNNLQSGLLKFIKNEQESSSKKIRKESYAASILQENSFDMVYSFNYTDINYFGKLLGLYHKIPCKHLHGDLSNNSIILGVDETLLPNNYEWLHKTSNCQYSYYDICNSLKDAKDIIFFGLSFGSIDFIYFERFFKELSMENTIAETSKQNITIITKDNLSQNAIKQNIRKMNVPLQRLFEQSHLKFVTTEN